MRFHESFKSICTSFMSYKQTWFDECRKMNALIHTIILLVNSRAGFWSLFSNLFHQQRAQLSTTCKPKQKGFIAAAPRVPLILVLGAPPPSVESYPKQGTPAVWERKMVSDDIWWSILGRKRTWHANASWIYYSPKPEGLPSVSCVLETLC